MRMGPIFAMGEGHGLFRPIDCPDEVFREQMGQCAIAQKGPTVRMAGAKPQGLLKLCHGGGVLTVKVQGIAHAAIDPRLVRVQDHGYLGLAHQFAMFALRQVDPCQPHMKIGVLIINPHGPLRGFQGPFELGRRRLGIEIERRIDRGIGPPGQALAKLVINFHAAGKQTLAFQMVVRSGFEKMGHAEVIAIPCARPRVGLTQHPLTLGCADFDIYMTGDPGGDFVLDPEYIAQLSVITFRLNIFTTGRGGHLHIGPQTVAGLA